MPLTLERLIYTSRAVPSAQSLLGIAEILGQARTLNELNGLTGALAIHDGLFLQVVEGPRLALDSLLKRLLQDARHEALEVMDRHRAEQRAFAQWRMVGPLMGSRAAPLVEGARSGALGAEGVTARLAELASSATFRSNPGVRYCGRET